MTTVDVELVKHEEPKQIRKSDISNPILGMLNSVIEKGVKSEDVATLREMITLYKEMEADGAKKSFAIAFSTLQSEMPQIAATRIIPKKDGTLRSTFASFDDLMSAIQPLVGKHGFSISFDMEVGEGRVVAVCILTHLQGHSESRKAAVRLSPPPETSPAQQDAATLTFAKRLALCNMFNVSISHDDDARMEGQFISPEWAVDLRQKCKDVKWDERKFLQLAGAEDFSKIREGKLAVLLNAIKLKEEATKAATKKPDVKPEPGIPSPDEQKKILEEELKTTMFQEPRR